MNHELEQQLAAHRKRLPERTLPLFCHVLNAHQIWTARIRSLPAVGPWDTFPLSEAGARNDENLRQTLAILDNIDLLDEVEYRNSKGRRFENNVRDILFHISNHSTHHKGQIVSDLRQAGIDPVVTDYIFYKR